MTKMRWSDWLAWKYKGEDFDLSEARREYSIYLGEEV